MMIMFRSCFLIVLTLLLAIRGDEVCTCTCASASANGTCDESFLAGYSDETKCEEECTNQCAEDVSAGHTVVSNITCAERSNTTAPGADPYHDFEDDGTADETTNGSEKSSDAISIGDFRVGWSLLLASMFVAVTL